MPCMGPNINEQELEKAYQEIIDLLASKYGILTMPAPLNSLKDSRKEVLKQFKTELRNVFFQDACECF